VLDNNFVSIAKIFMELFQVKLLLHRTHFYKYLSCDLHYRDEDTQISGASKQIPNLDHQIFHSLEKYFKDISLKIDSKIHICKPRFNF